MEKKVYVFGDYEVINFLFAKEFRPTPAFHWAIPPKPYFFSLLRVPGGCEALVNYINRIKNHTSVDLQQPEYDKCAESFFRLFQRKKNGKRTWFIDEKIQLTSHPQQRKYELPKLGSETEGNPVICMDLGLGCREEFHEKLTEFSALFTKRPYLIRTHDPMKPEWRKLREKLQDEDNYPGIWALLSEDIAEGALRAPGVWSDHKRIILDWLKKDNTLWECESWRQYLVIRIEYDGILILGPGDSLRDGALRVAPASQPGSFLRNHRYHVTGSGIAFIASFVEALLSSDYIRLSERQDPDKLNSIRSFEKQLDKCALEALVRSRSVLKHGYVLHPDIDPESKIKPIKEFQSFWNFTEKNTKHDDKSHILPALEEKEVDNLINDLTPFKEPVGDWLTVEAIVYGDEITLRENLVLTMGKLKVTGVNFARDLLVLERRLKDHAENRKKTLSFAIFGEPGSGKTFVARELVKAIDSDGTLFKERCINLSQFADDKSRLLEEFKEIEQITVGGKIPFVLWDEFDSVLDGDQCGWLRFFLMPMEDGKYYDGKKSLDLGTCVFVFMGGTFEKLEEFRKWMKEKDSKRLKGPDFHSRLERVLQLPSCEFNTKSQIKLSASDPAKLLRAHLIRSFLEQDTQVLKVEPKVIAYLSHVRLCHGPRSLRRIIQASALDRTDTFGLIHLPSENVLELHTESDKKTGVNAAHPSYFVESLMEGGYPAIRQDPIELLWRSQNHEEAEARTLTRQKVGRKFNELLAKKVFVQRQEDLKKAGWTEGSKFNIAIGAKVSPGLEDYDSLPPDLKRSYMKSAKKAIAEADDE